MRSLGLLLVLTGCATSAGLSKEMTFREVQAAILACPSARDSVGWHLTSQGIVLLAPGLLVEHGILDCITARLEQSGVPFTFEDNRRK